MKDRYISIPGTKTHELPPLLISVGQYQSDATTPDLNSLLPEVEDMLAPTDADEALLERRKVDLALQLAEHYHGLSYHWQWGEYVLEWVRQCEITFASDTTLRNLLHPDVWPHARRASFITLLGDKQVPTRGVQLERAVGLRLTFRQLPLAEDLTSQFLFFLNTSVADAAYQRWSYLSPGRAELFPPERFHFDVVEIGD